MYINVHIRNHYIDFNILKSIFRDLNTYTKIFVSVFIRNKFCTKIIVRVIDFKVRSKNDCGVYC